MNKLHSLAKEYRDHSSHYIPWSECLEYAMRNLPTKNSMKYKLHLYSGCYNPRKSRAGSSWSDHAWTVAIDIAAKHNGLHTTWKSGIGRFRMPQVVVDIFRKHGFQVGFKRSEGTRRDMMHIAYIDRP